MRRSPDFPGARARARRIAEMIRVDHAGEYGAVQIYRGQQAVFARSPATAHAAALVADMEAGEAEHLATFDRLIAARKVRPTLLAPIWRAAGYTLGAATALMGEKAAHACTAAVEEVIEQHYAEQAADLDDDPELAKLVTEFAADERGHRETALSEGAEQAPGYQALSAIIKLGCRAAIKISEKV